MTVSEWAPRVLTCRNCLGRVENPYGMPPGTVAPQAALMPRRVIPIEQQIAGDSRIAVVLLYVLAALFGGAAALSASVTGGPRFAIGLGLVAVFAAGIATLQLVYPRSDEIRATADVFGKVAKVILAIILILVGIVLLLVGMCFVLMTGSYWHG
jgi:hypothetical protein